MINYRSIFNQLLFPQQCLLCAGGNGGELALCRSCLEDLPWHGPDACPQCALPAPGGQTCGRCLQSAPAFDATRALFRYAYPLDGMLQHYKYRQQLGLAGTFGTLMLQCFDCRTAFDRIIPMPLHPKRLAERGFNQSLEIARLLARQLNITLDTRSCHRIRFTPPQASLPHKARIRNMRGAFRCDAALEGQHILLVDDVMTTGASLHELAATVKAAGASRVECWVIARTLSS